MGTSLCCPCSRGGSDHGRSSSDLRRVDPTTGLNALDVALMRESWNELNRRQLVMDMGRKLFHQLFEKYPYIENLFESGHGKEQPEAKQKMLERHIQTFMNTIGMYVEFIDKPEPLVGLLHKVSLNHLGRQIRTQDMKLLGTEFVDCMQSVLEDFVSYETLDAWDAFFMFILNVYHNVERQVMTIPRAPQPRSRLSTDI